MGKRSTNPDGRPREFGKRTAVLVPIPDEFLSRIDKFALDVGTSRARLIGEMLGIATVVVGMGYMKIDEKGVHFRNWPFADSKHLWDCVTVDKDAKPPSGLMTVSVSRDVVLGLSDEPEELEQKPAVPKSRRKKPKSS